MKSKKLILLAGLVLTCQLTLSACQTDKNNATSQPKTKQVTKKEDSKKKQSSKKMVATKKDRKGVAGVDFPTDDGFILTKDSKILSKTDNGIVVEHDGHSHFIFYADLKGSQFDYLIPKGANMRKPQMVAASSQTSVPGANDPHHHYVFNPADIVAEDALGYTVRHGDHFHYILKSLLGGAVNYKPQAQLVTISNPNQRYSGVHFATSDGFLFDGTGIVGRTAQGLLVNHDGHTHVVTYDSIRHSKWAHLIEEKQEAPAKKERSAELSKEIELKKAHLAKSVGISVDSIQVEESEEVIVLIYPHGDHSHSTALDEISLDKPFDPHAHSHAQDRIGMATLKRIGFDDEVIMDILHADAETPFPSKERDEAKMREWLKTVTKLNIGQRQNPLKRFGLNLMPNLEVLGIGFTPIDDITPVFQFKNLKQLWMTQTGITDYSFLEKMPLLEGLDISQNNLKDLSFLSKYKQLTLVAAADNEVEDITVLGELPNLKFLVLSNNKISDLKPLEKLAQIEELHLDNNMVTDLTPVSNKESLKVIDLSKNKTVDMSSLKAPKLETLMLNETNVTSLEFLANNPSLENLTINQSKLASLSGIETSQAIDRLEAKENQIKSLALANKQTTLRSLDLSGNQVSNLEGINQLTALENLSLSKNQLTNLNLSEKNTSVTSLDVSHNQIPLKDLELNENKIPVAIADNFVSVNEGSIVGNGTDQEKAELAEKTKHQVAEEAQAHDDHDHEHEHEHDDEHDHNHDHHHAH
ncbi:pneumococcal-type histidine triad protein [Streptococcus halichoeri]|uniref:pneumococcal-type histidine triad protein n=1 Tax=Streptococcus halichoeri TaxID=254785 RepID=UPI00135CC5DB|nr:pneumococcal-type histidine triad protein [Streptococcus halichoeri]